jgi:Raf kinase inhibitor-like YbhB/YbcL family protein
MRRITVLAAALAASAAMAGAAWPQTLNAAPKGLTPSFQVTSPKYQEFSFLDKRHAASERDCGGQNISPPIAWSGEPKDTTKSFAVVQYDPDGANGQGEGKWVGYNIPTTIHAFAEGAMSGTTPGITVGLDDHNIQEYYGACPPYGKMHHYVFGVYALDIPVGELKANLNREDLLKAIQGHTRAYQSIVFYYQRTPPPGGIPASSPPPVRAAKPQ